jgi:hypothetical protein
VLRRWATDDTWVSSTSPQRRQAKMPGCSSCSTSSSCSCYILLLLLYLLLLLPLSTVHRHHHPRRWWCWRWISMIVYMSVKCPLPTTIVQRIYCF